MDDERNKIKKQIENVEFCIWLFSRHNGTTSSKIITEYKERKKELLQRYNELSDSYKGAENSD